MNGTLNSCYQLIADMPQLGKKLYACKKILALCALPVCIFATAAAATTVHRSSSPITDSSGRVEVIVDFDFDPDTDTEFDEFIDDVEYRNGLDIERRPSNF